MIGLHNIRNALAAISVAVGVGINTKVIKEGVQKFSGVKRRFNLIYRNGRWEDFCDDYEALDINEKKLLLKGKMEADYLGKK